MKTSVVLRMIASIYELYKRTIEHALSLTRACTHYSNDLDYYSLVSTLLTLSTRAHNYRNVFDFYFLLSNLHSHQMLVPQYVSFPAVAHAISTVFFNLRQYIPASFSSRLFSLSKRLFVGNSGCASSFFLMGPCFWMSSIVIHIYQFGILFQSR